MKDLVGDVHRAVSGGTTGGGVLLGSTLSGRGGR